MKILDHFGNQSEDWKSGFWFGGVVCGSGAGAVVALAFFCVKFLQWAGD